VEIRASVAPRSASSTDIDDKNPSAGLISGTSGSPYRLRYTGSVVRGNQRQTPPQSSRGSYMGSGGRYGGGGSTSRGAGDNEADDEPLVFDMSELEKPRASLEEGRGGAPSASGERRGGYEPPRGSNRRW
jgi:autophagy-related protein 13